MNFDTLIEGFQRLCEARTVALSKIITKVFPIPFFIIRRLSEAYL